jgi:hypothetical protein
MNPCDYFLWNNLKDRVCYTNPETVQDLQAEIEVVAKDITGDMLGDTVDSFVVRLQRVM